MSVLFAGVLVSPAGFTIGHPHLLFGATLFLLGVWGTPPASSGFSLYLLGDGLLVFAAGIVLRWKRSFFLGAALVVIAVVLLLKAPVVDHLQALSVWYYIFGIGLSMVAIVVLLDRQRQRISGWVDGARQRLEARH